MIKGHRWSDVSGTLAQDQYLQEAGQKVQSGCIFWTRSSEQQRRGGMVIGTLGKNWAAFATFGHRKRGMQGHFAEQIPPRELIQQRCHWVEQRQEECGFGDVRWCCGMSTSNRTQEKWDQSSRTREKLVCAISAVVTADDNSLLGGTGDVIKGKYHRPRTKDCGNCTASWGQEDN